MRSSDASRKSSGSPSSGGLSTNKVVAKIAATLAKPHGLSYVPAGSERDFLEPLAIELIPGIGPKTRASLNRSGIKTIGDLFRRSDLPMRYLNLGEVSTHSHRHDHSIGNETTLERPAQTIVQMEKILWELVEEVGGRLRREAVFARCITLKIRYTDFQTLTRSRTLAAPTCFDKEIFSAVSDLLRQNLRRDRAVRLLGVSASSLQSGGWQEPLFQHQRRDSFEKLYRGIDELRRKFGDQVVGAATPRNRAG
jgi:DNA polymerase-4